MVSSGGNGYCGWGGLLALVLLGLVLVVVIVARVDCHCLLWLQWIVSVCRGSNFGVIMVVALGLSMRWLWFCGGHVTGFTFVGGGFGFVFWPSMCVVAMLEFMIALG